MTRASKRRPPTTATKQSRVAKKYQRRIAKLESSDRKMRSKIRGYLRLGLKQALETQLYARTPLKVSKAMLRSVFTITTKNSIAVGLKGSIAPHNSIRLDRTGTSKLGGHDMTLKPAEFIREVYGPKIEKEGRGFLHDVIGD